MRDPLAFLYEAERRDTAAFRPNWCGPAFLPHAEEVLVARYEEEPGGQPVDVFCTAMPARFHRLVVHASDGKPGYSLGTGSGCTEWAATTAKLIAAGMVAMNSPTTTHHHDTTEENPQRP